MIHKSSFLPPVTFNADPNEYRKLGENFERGDVRRVMNNSQLRDFRRCPHRWKVGAQEEEDTPSLEWGALLDCIVLTPDRFEKVYAVAPETFTTLAPSYVLTTEFPGEWNPRQKVCQQWKKAKEAEGVKVYTPEDYEDAKTPKEWGWIHGYCKQWRTDQEAKGKIAIKADQASEAWKAAAIIHKDERLHAFLAGAKTQVQVCVEWRDPDTKLVIPIKCLIDIVPDPGGEYGDMLGDLKSTRCAAARAWARAVHEQGYAMQAALYIDAYNAAAGLKYREFAHVVSENFHPYETARRVLSTEFLQIGRAEYMRALVDYCYCLKNDFWPGYDDMDGSSAEMIDGWRVVSPEAWMLGEPA